MKGLVVSHVKLQCPVTPAGMAGVQNTRMWSLQLQSLATEFRQSLPE
ncbi:MAG: hypothetical protein ACRERU_06310 [Methylococcales bacterium]